MAKFFFKAVSSHRANLFFEGSIEAKENKEITQKVKSILVEHAVNGKCQEGELFSVWVYKDQMMIKPMDRWSIAAKEKGKKPAEKPAAKAAKKPAKAAKNVAATKATAKKVKAAAT